MADGGPKNGNGDLTGNAKIDAYVRVIKFLGFPVLVASALLYMIWQMLSDYRESIREGTAAYKTTADAFESTGQTLSQLKTGQDRQLENQAKQTEAINQTMKLMQTILEERRDLLKEIIQERASGGKK